MTDPIVPPGTQVDWVKLGSAWYVRYKGPPSRPGASGTYHWGPWGTEWAARTAARIIMDRSRSGV